MNEVFESSTRAAGDLAGVFEHDGETGYFYLCVMRPSQHIVDAIQVVQGDIALEPHSIGIVWSEDESQVSLHLLGEEWARFEPVTKTKWIPEKPFPFARHPRLVDRPLRSSSTV